MNLQISRPGSKQNPAWSPNGRELVFTLWEKYNKGKASLHRYVIATGRLSTVISDGATNCSQPGSCWNAKTNRIIYSSDKASQWDDWPWSINPDGSNAQRYKQQPGKEGQEPTFHPDGNTICFERHNAGTDDGGTLVVLTLGVFTVITPLAWDCRQPCYSPDGKYIVFQRRAGDQWDLWLYAGVGEPLRQLTYTGNATDATWHPDSKHVLFSGEGGLYQTDLNHNVKKLLSAPYLGAPSWSPDGQWIACEAYSTDEPDGSPGTWLELHKM